MPGVDLDAEVRRVDPDRWLASRFIVDRRARTDVIALYAFDHELARAPAVTSATAMAEIRLVWWREAIDEIFSGAAVRGHPTALALAEAVRQRGLPRAPFETMIEARLAALEATEMGPAEALALASGTEGELACLAAICLGEPGEAANAEAAGSVWGLMLLRRAGNARGEAFDSQIRERLTEARRAARHLQPASFPAALPATLARADLNANSPGQVEKRGRLTWAALTGRL
ncbi:MAG TPA: squalene/phytoene synthase family protein [Caulobacteraceae bacterium]